MLQNFLIFYGVAGFVIGGFVAGMDSVNFQFRGRPAPWPRLWAGAIAAIAWPVILWKLATGR